MTRSIEFTDVLSPPTAAGSTDTRAAANASSGIPPLSEAERVLFSEKGWLVVRGAVPAARVADLERALDAVIPEAGYPMWGRRVVEVAGISRGSAEIDRHARDPGIARLGAGALGARRVQLLQDTALVKPAAGGARVEWHQDYSYLAYLDRPAVVTARLALTPCTRDTGCLRVIDGSHTWGLCCGDLSFRRESVEDTLATLPADLREQARAREVTVELEPGDISLHHCLIFHASDENRGTRPRKTLIVRLMDAACRLDPSRLPSPEAARLFPTDADGHLVGLSFPLVWDAGG